MPKRLAQMRTAFLLCLSAILLVSSAVSYAASAGSHSVTVSGHSILLDGKPFQIIAGEMHYPRVPRAYWRDRLRKARAMGLNTITTYVFWNVHEPRPGVYDFSGQNDIAEFIREAQQVGLYVILRPGPYVCAEWELGGYPSWLLKDRGLILRSNNPKYMAAVNTWFSHLARQISPLLYSNGGPIIAVQLENEYGAFGSDQNYLEAMKSALVSSGMGSELLYTADPPEYLPHGSLPELPAAINFGSGEAAINFAKLDQLRPNGIRMAAEYWNGWFDHWGERHHVTDGNREAADLNWMLQRGYSVNLYMFEGGTSFGWMNGANSNGTTYEPDTTSYDYDAPLDERGEPSPKYFLFRNAIRTATGITPPSVPPTLPARVFTIAPRLQTASLWRNLPTPTRSAKLLTMEDLGQSYGYILYRTRLSSGEGGPLVIKGLHDYANVYLNQQIIGALDRRLGQSTLVLPASRVPATLDILVENSGRVNYTKVIRGERKGITGSVSLAGQTLSKWEIYALPMTNPSRLRFQSQPCSGPCFYRTSMTVDHPADTWIDTDALRKGELWINGRMLGRFWSIGPQFTLFEPGPWLHRGENDILFFDLDGSPADHLQTTDHPIFRNPG